MPLRGGLRLLDCDPVFVHLAANSFARRNAKKAFGSAEGVRDLNLIHEQYDCYVNNRLNTQYTDQLTNS